MGKWKDLKLCAFMVIEKAAVKDVEAAEPPSPIPSSLIGNEADDHDDSDSDSADGDSDDDSQVWL